MAKKDGGRAPSDPTPDPLPESDPDPDRDRPVNRALLNKWYSPRVMRRLDYLRWQWLQAQPGDRADK